MFVGRNSWKYSRRILSIMFLSWNFESIIYHWYWFTLQKGFISIACIPSTIIESICQVIIQFSLSFSEVSEVQSSDKIKRMTKTCDWRQSNLTCNNRCHNSYSVHWVQTINHFLYKKLKLLRISHFLSNI